MNDMMTVAEVAAVCVQFSLRHGLRQRPQSCRASATNRTLAGPSRALVRPRYNIALLGLIFP